MKTINCEQLREQQTDVCLIDVRELDEHARESIPGAICVPLSAFSAEALAKLPKDKLIVIHCQSGNRTCEAYDRLLAAGFDQVFVLQGGINAWKKSGGATRINKKARLPLMRQMQIIVGFMVLLGVVLSFCVSPYFSLLSAFFGAGLIFAGITGFCGMVRFLAILPYNKSNQE